MQVLFHIQTFTFERIYYLFISTCTFLDDYFIYISANTANNGIYSIHINRIQMDLYLTDGNNKYSSSNELKMNDVGANCELTRCI